MLDFKLQEIADSVCCSSLQLQDLAQGFTQSDELVNKGGKVQQMLSLPTHIPSTFPTPLYNDGFLRNTPGILHLRAFSMSAGKEVLRLLETAPAKWIGGEG